MSDCIFCSIVKGDIDAEIVFENDYALGFLDANPLADGHTVVVPKEHFERFSDLTEEVATGMFAIVKEINEAVMAGLEADGTNIGINDGEAAGQAIPHTHVHVIPRYHDDGGGSLHSIVKGEGESELAEIGEKLRAETYGD